MKIQEEKPRIRLTAANTVFLFLLCGVVFFMMFSFVEKSSSDSLRLIPPSYQKDQTKSTSNSSFVEKSSSESLRLIPPSYQKDQTKSTSNSSFVEKSSSDSLRLIPPSYQKDQTKSTSNSIHLVEQLEKDLRPNQSLPDQVKTTILFYNRPSWIGKKFANLDNCPYKCKIINDRNKWEESGAVIFVASQNPGVPKRKKAPGQAWVFLNLESPATYKIDFQKWKNLINWTMTYRLDSDIVLLNHGVERSETEGFDPYNKTRPINWVVSNCHAGSKRDEFVRILQKHIKVDIYGRCGTLKVPCKSLANNNCWGQLFNKYFFYLSFENSFCQDYITEKAFNPLKNNIVPIVRGGAVYRKYFPLKSYIDTADYKTVKELADYLKHLVQNEAEYDRYFDWRKHYQAKVYCCQPKSFCELCRRLHYKDMYHRQYENLHDWWHKAGNCHSVDDLHRRR